MESNSNSQETKTISVFDFLNQWKNLIDLFVENIELNDKRRIIPKYRKGKIPQFRKNGRLYEPKSQSHILLFNHNQIRNHKNHDMPFRLYGGWELPSTGMTVKKKILNLDPTSYHSSFNDIHFNDIKELEYAN